MDAAPPPDPLDRLLPPPTAGDRLVVRHLLPDGRATDLIGWLDRLDPDELRLADAGGELHRVVRSTVVAARRVPVARGGPDPMRTTAEDLQRVALPAWLALAEPLGGWTLRAGGGFTGRANSCLAVGEPGLPYPEAASRITEFAARHGIEARAQVVDGSEAEDRLRALGWVDTHVLSDVLVVRLNDLLGTGRPDARVRVGETLTPQWEDAYRESRPGPVDAATLRSILAGRPPYAFADAQQDGRVIAIGRGHLSADWLGIASVWTAPERRRDGWAGRVLLALGHWGARLGARNGYLQVATDNAPAQRAYAQLGFRLHHRYRSLTPG